MTTGVLVCIKNNNKTAAFFKTSLYINGCIIHRLLKPDSEQYTEGQKSNKIPSASYHMQIITRKLANFQLGTVFFPGMIGAASWYI